MEQAGASVLVGFFTTRKVKATSVEDAVRLAISDAAEELGARARPIDAVQPQWAVDQVRLVGRFEVVRRRYRGFTFYPWDKRYE